MIELLPNLTELKVFDNTQEGDPRKGQAPASKLLLQMRDGKIVSLSDLGSLPQSAKPIVQAAMQFRGDLKRNEA